MATLTKYKESKSLIEDLPPGNSKFFINNVNAHALSKFQHSTWGIEHEGRSETAKTSLFSNQMISDVNIEKILANLPNI